MKSWKPVPVKKLDKKDRERQVLLRLVDYYIQTGKPVGSNTLKEAGLEDLSSATIRNYFAHLEEEGFLHQSHASGGRIPTNLAFRTYARAHLVESEEVFESFPNPFDILTKIESREVSSHLQEATELFSRLSNCAAFLISPRFDQDFVVTLKLVPIDIHRCVCIMVTDFGVIQTELIHLKNKLSNASIKGIESYFQWRLTNHVKPDFLDPEEETLAQSIYNELMLRRIVAYTHFTTEDVYRTGFSRLLSYPCFQDSISLASGLALFEDSQTMRHLLRESSTHEQLRFWIGDDLSFYGIPNPTCSVIAMPYFINNKSAGAIGLLGPINLPYKHIFILLRQFSKSLSQILTQTLYKFKIHFRSPTPPHQAIATENGQRIGSSGLKLLDQPAVDSPFIEK